MDRDPRSGSSATTLPAASRKKAPPGNWRLTRGSRSAVRSGAGSRSSRFTWEAVAARCRTSNPWLSSSSTCPATVRADHSRAATSCWSRRDTRTPKAQASITTGITALTASSM